MKNIKIILTIILTVFVLSNISAASIHNYYKIDLNYNRGDINVFSTNIEQSLDLLNNSLGRYTAIPMDYKNNVLDIYYFDVPNFAVYEYVANGTIYGFEQVELSEVNFTLFIPYYENATKILIYDSNASKKRGVDVSIYSKKYKEYKEFSNLNQEQLNESELTPTDKITEVNKPVTEKKETLLEKISKYWWIFLIVLLVLVGIIINYVSKEDNNKKGHNKN